jgi:hypothetical protein
MYFVIEDRVYSAAYDEVNNRYPLVSVAMAADGAVTVTDEGEGVAVIPAGYRKCSLEEVIAIFAIVPEGEYEPFATITGNEPVTVYLDEANKAVALTVANPALGDFSSVASSNTNIATVTEVDGTFTIVPVAVGTCNVTAKWTPTDTDFAVSNITIPVTVARRKIEIKQVRNQNLTKGNANAKTIILEPNVDGVTYTVTSSDTDICTAAVTGTTGHENDLVLTPDDATLGKCKICVSAVDSNGKADDSEVMSFWVNVCDSAVTITAISDQTVDAGESKEITVTCAGAEIREVTTSDATHVTVEKTAKLKFKINAVGDAGDTATVVVYCDKRGYGEDSEDLTVTIT